jgi:hypothetical protein
LLNIAGQSAQDNRDLFGFAFVPPDTNGAVGATQFVQIVNVTIAVYDKSSGAVQLGPAAIHTLWSGFGGLCEFGGGTPTFADGGDPVVLYDHLARRWLVSQLQFDATFTHTAQCVAVSTSSDATGSYSRYEFDFGSNFPDYPKFGVWPDAYTTALMSSHSEALPARRRVHSTAMLCSPERLPRRSASSSRPPFSACYQLTSTAARSRRQARRIPMWASLIPRT